MTMTTSAASNALDQHTPLKGWWREPYVWLIIGGPLVVVVAAIFTAVIAFRAPDPVIDHNDYQQQVLLKKKHVQSKELLLDDLAKLQPANQARNHAASPFVPALKEDKDK